VGAAESGRPTLTFLTKEAVRLATEGAAAGVAHDGCPPLADLVRRYEAAGTTTCAPSASTTMLGPSTLISGAEIQGTVPLWAWIGDEPATTFSY
jgi:predicted peroxiredoxin